MALQTVNQFDIGTKFSNLGSGFQQGQQMANQFQIGQQNQQTLDTNAEKNRVMSVVRGASEISNLPDDASKLNALMRRKADLVQQGLPTQDTDEVISLFQSGDSEGANGLIQGVVNAGIQQGLLKAPIVTKPQPGFTIGNQRFDASGKLLVTGADPKVTPLEQANIDLLKAKTKTETSESSGGVSQEETLNTLVANASPELQLQAKAAFELAGGGDKGVKALSKVLESGVESERRAAAPETLKANFPNADETEIQELQAVVDSSKTTESGFKAAGQLREKQRQVKKGKVFQARAVELLDRILGASELNDVIGSIEGSDESLIPFGGQKIRGDAESEIIADIEEAGNILTADNLDIMSGVLSETDIKIISNLAGGALNRKRGEAAFKKDVAKLREKMAGQLGVLPKGVTEDDISTTMKANNLSRQQVLERLGRK